MFQCNSNAVSVYLTNKKSLSNIKVESVQGDNHVFLTNGDLLIPDEKLTQKELFLLSSRYENTVRRLEIFNIKKLIIYLISLVLSLAIVRYAILYSTPFLVFIFPLQLEKKLGEVTYETLSEEIFEDSKLSEALKNEILNEYEFLLSNTELSYKPRIIFHKSDILGANALAFPGGPIVVTDELVNLLEPENLVAPIIAHELIHIKKRHSITQLIKMIGLSTFTWLMLGSQDAIIEELLFLSVNLYALHNSRNFEKEADLGALILLENSGFSKLGLSKALKKLSHDYCKKEKKELVSCLEEQGGGWLSTHPSTKTRLNYLKNVTE